MTKKSTKSAIPHFTQLDLYELSNTESRHYCKICNKKRKTKYMTIVGYNAYKSLVWRCLDCKSENRKYGRN